MVKFTVDGNRATADAGQTCMLEIPTAGLQSIDITSWTLTLADGVITSQFTGGLAGLPAFGHRHLDQGDRRQR